MILRWRLIFPFLAVLAAGTAPLGADVKGSGNIGFDPNDDGVREMTLTTTGLGIGTLSPSTNLHVLGNASISNSLIVGSTSGNSSLEINGSFGMNSQTASSNLSAGSNTVILLDTSNANLALTLPYAGNVGSRAYYLKKVSASNSVWVLGGGNYIDDMGVMELTTASMGFPFTCVVSNSQQWYITSKSSEVGEIASGNLVGWWKLDESSGNSASDLSGRSNTGTLSGGFSFSTNSVAGKVATGLDFDGSNDLVSCGNATSLDITSDKVTICAWIKAGQGSTAGGERIIAKSVAANADPYMRYGLYKAAGGTKITFSISTGGAGTRALINSSTDLTVGSWVHVAGVYDGAQLKIYFNAASDATPVSNTGAIATTTNPLVLGCNEGTNPDNNFFLGALDDVRIYNRALSADEILHIYKQR